MGYDMIIGRDTADKASFGDKGLIYLGKGYVKMGAYTSLSNRILMDVARSHVVLIAGKRGTGKSYTLGVIAEELAKLPQESAKNIASIVFDTMGIFWTMKYKNEKDLPLLKEWQLFSEALNAKVFVPYGKAEEYKQRGIPVDYTFALNPSELKAEDWLTLFGIEMTSLPGTLIERIIYNLSGNKEKFSINDILEAISQDIETSNDVKSIVRGLFLAASSWGIFATEKAQGTSVKDLLTPGATTVLDVSVYSSIGSVNVRALVISLISRKIFEERMTARKQEELDSIREGKSYLSYSKHKDPLVWMFIDEAHEFLPKTGKTPATDALIQILREGRQPGISIVLATQQPGQIHHDVMTQADIVIAHRVTAKQDIEALNEIMQTYVLDSIRKQLDDLPSLKGSAIVLDDNSERIYPIRVRPRSTWHGGEAPTAISADFKL
jgi:uncharacterized protein